MEYFNIKYFNDNALVKDLRTPIGVVKSPKKSYAAIQQVPQLLSKLTTFFCTSIKKINNTKCLITKGKDAKNIKKNETG